MVTLIIKNNAEVVLEQNLIRIVYLHFAVGTKTKDAFHDKFSDQKKKAICMLFKRYKERNIAI